MNAKELKEELHRYKNPLSRKIIRGCGMFSAICCLALGIFDATMYANEMLQQKRDYLEGILRYTLTELDGDALETYAETGEKDEKFAYMEGVLDRIKTHYDIDYIEILKPLNANETDSMMYIMSGATAQERADGDDTIVVELGELTEDEYTTKIASEYLSELSAGAGETKFLKNRTEYGYEYSGLIPVMDSQGEAVAVLAVDISINEIVRGVRTYIVEMVLELTVFIGLFLGSFYLWLKKRVLIPIARIQASAEKIVQSTHNQTDPSKIKFEDPDIHSEDELQALSESLMIMSEDLKGFLKGLLSETKEKERIGTELNVATHIQSSMLPCIFPAFPGRDEVDIYASMMPAKEVGGDFYDLFMIDDRHLAIVMADVSGKGVPAALFMVIGKTLIKDHTVPGRNLGEVFSEVNNLLCESNDNGMFITAFEGVLDLVTGEFRYVNAGHEQPFIYRKDKGYEAYKTKPGFVLAGMEDFPYQEHVTQLEVGDKLFQYTDGVTEATNVDNELYGMDRLSNVLNAMCLDATPEETLKNVKEDIDDFVGEADQFDDITMLCFHYRKKMEEK